MSELKIGDKFVCKKNNICYDSVVIINDELLEDDEYTLYFLNYYGFEKII